LAGRDIRPDLTVAAPSRMCTISSPWGMAFPSACAGELAREHRAVAIRRQAREGSLACRLGGCRRASFGIVSRPSLALRSTTVTMFPPIAAWMAELSSLPHLTSQGAFSMRAREWVGRRL
jgi:hypothetical protein